MQALINSIIYKQPKAIPHYSTRFTEFVGQMLMKKKEDRPIITDLIDYFNDRQVPCFKQALLTELDQENYQKYKSLSVRPFEKKRSLEKNMTSYSKDFQELKKRI